MSTTQTEMDLKEQNHELFAKALSLNFTAEVGNVVRETVHMPPLTFDDDDSTIQDDFIQFHTSNPGVYKALVNLALAQIDRGVKKGSINQLFEVIRYSTSLNISDGEDEFKLNNNYRSRYSRLIMDNEQKLEGFFRTRQLKAE